MGNTNGTVPNRYRAGRISASSSSTSLGNPVLRISAPVGRDQDRVLDADVQLLLGQVDDRLDGHHHPGLERQRSSRRRRAPTDPT